MKINSLILIATALLLGALGLVLTTWIEPFNTAHVSLFSMTVTINGETLLCPYRNLGGGLMLFGSFLFTVGFVSSYFQAHVDIEKPEIRELEINVIPLGEIPVAHLFSK